MRRYYSILILVLACLCLSGSLFASEIDYWTKRNEVMQSDGQKSLQIWNRYTQNLLKQVEEKVQASGTACREDKLIAIAYSTLASSSLAGGVHESRFEDYIRNSPELEGYRYCVPFKDSVYAKFKGWDAPAFFFPSLVMGCIGKMGDVIVGGDKLGHFISTGYSYYVKAKLKSDFMGALAYGDDSEKTYFGFLGSAAYSYGDLNANYAGMTFWSRLTPQYTKASKAYFICKDNKWVLNKKNPFDWGHYINHAWDEAINVNYYRNENLRYKFFTRLAEVADSYPEVSEGKCLGIVKHYKDKQLLLKALVSPLCAMSAQEEEPGILNQELYDYFVETHKSLMDDNKNAYTLSNMLWSLYRAIQAEILFII